MLADRVTSHDLPTCPRTRVHRTRYGWTWEHLCMWHGHQVVGGVFGDQPTAFKEAHDHAQHCVLA